MTDIRPVSDGDRASWERLWEAYLTFYESSLPAGHNDVLWDRIRDGAHPIRCLVAESGGGVVGLVHFFPHPDTWEAGPVCYLQDLFVAPAARRRGIGGALIEAVAAEAERHGWRHVYWLTAEDNAPARRLYDRLTGGHSGFIAYELRSGSGG